MNKNDNLKWKCVNRSVVSLFILFDVELHLKIKLDFDRKIDLFDSIASKFNLSISIELALSSKHYFIPLKIACLVILRDINPHLTFK